MRLIIWLIISPEGAETQQRELESSGKIHSTLNLHGNPSLSGLGGALSVIHQRVSMYSTTIA